MCLSGRLDEFPLAEVLRLVGRSGLSGGLTVDAGATTARVFLDRGVLTLATTCDDPALGRIGAGWALPGTAEPASGERRVDGTDAAEPRAVTAYEHTVDGLHRMSLLSGSFTFEPDVGPPLDTGLRIDVRDAVEALRIRSAEVAEMEEVLPHPNTVIGIRADLDETEVTIPAAGWRILARLTPGSTVRTLAAEMGTTDVLLGRQIVDLVRRGLVELSRAPQDAGVPDGNGRDAAEARTLAEIRRRLDAARRRHRTLHPGMMPQSHRSAATGSTPSSSAGSVPIVSS